MSGAPVGPMNHAATVRSNMLRAIKAAGKTPRYVALTAGVPIEILTDDRDELMLGDVCSVAEVLGAVPAGMAAWFDEPHLRLVV